MGYKAGITQTHGRLYLLARLPAKDGSGAIKQQRIPTGLPDTPADRKRVQPMLQRLQREMDRGTFNWDDWVERKVLTWAKAIDRLYNKRVLLGRTGESTWRTYWAYLRQLPPSEQVSSERIAKHLSKYDREQWAYRDNYYLMRDLAPLAGVQFPEVPIPIQSANKSAPVVPDDAEIIEWVQKLKPCLSWHLGMMATYGLRPHELYQCDFIDDQHRLQVSHRTKTGERLAIPLEPDWVELFDLRNIRRHPSPGLQPTWASRWLNDQRRTWHFPFKPYALRHAYAGRLWRMGGSKLDIYTAARLMGHTIKEHERTYRAWIAPHTIAHKAEEAISANLSATANRLPVEAKRSLA